MRVNCQLGYQSIMASQNAVIFAAQALLGFLFFTEVARQKDARSPEKPFRCYREVFFCLKATLDHPDFLRRRRSWVASKKVMPSVPLSLPIALSNWS
jgi:hypothetical protein